MRKRWLWIVPGLVIFAGPLVIWIARAPSLPTVQFADGRSSRVLKVSFGTNHVFSPEALWKKTLRAVLPQALERPLGPLQQSKAATQFDSLAIFMEPLPNLRGATPVYVLFPDGTRSSAYWLPLQRPLILSNYPRGEKELKLRLSDGNNSVHINVPNPRPIKRKSWTLRAFPQTNYVTGTEVVLTKCTFIDNYVFIFLDARSLSDRPVGWMQWQTGILDPLGNYHVEIRNRRPYLPGAKNEREFRVVATGLEYISAGFVSPPATGQYQILGSKGRATNWGVQFIAVLGPGAYEISKGFAVTRKGPGLFPTNTIRARGSGWLVECANPVALSISDRPVSEVRIRERIGADDGRVFGGRRSGSESHGGLIAQLFSPRLPTVTTNLEVEVIVRWPAAEFFVQKPE